MKIAFMGAPNVGKSTLIENFLKQWPMYKKPKVTYRDLVKKENLSVNKNGTKESQKAILNALVDEAQQAVASEDRFIVFDRCVVDNIAFSLWHYAKETPGFTTEFIIDSKAIAAMALKYFDIIFYLPLRKEIPVEQKELRETDETFREEIDNIFASLVSSYEKNTKAFFPDEDCPAVIRLDGPADMRLPQLKLYIKDDGTGFGEQDGSLLDVSNL
jgi:GTPase SAR1 family protein